MFMVLTTLLEFTGITWWMQNSARWLPTFGPSQQTWAIGPLVDSYETMSTMTIYYYSAGKLLLILPSNGM